jgi:hypothetical protein
VRHPLSFAEARKQYAERRRRRRRRRNEIIEWKYQMHACVSRIISSCLQGNEVTMGGVLSSKAQFMGKKHSIHSRQ